jgi:DNA-binding phage protein
MSKKKQPKIKIKLVRAYFIGEKDRDPVIARLGAVAAKFNGKRSELARTAGVASGTVGNWWNKKAKKPTRQPKFATVASVGRALGKEGEQAIIDAIRNDGRAKK